MPSLRTFLIERDVAAFEPIDARPVFQSISEKRTALEHFKIFATISKEQTEIIVAPETVSELLARIQEAQLPEQEQIRERNRRRKAREAVDELEVHAQILSFPKVA